MRPAVSFSKVDIGLLAGSLSVLLVCVFYAYLGTIRITAGFSVRPSTWEVISVDEMCEQNPDCPQIGDVVKRVGSLDLETFQADRTVTIFRDYFENESATVVFERDSAEKTYELNARTVSRQNSALVSWIFPLTFWLAGTGALIFLRPRDERWLVLILLCYDTALWGSSGLISGSRFGMAAIVFRIFIWLFIPLVLHLHLILPNRLLRPKPLKRVLAPLYLVSFLFIFIDYFRNLPIELVYLAVLVVLVSVLVILLARQVVPATLEIRLASRLLLFGVSLGVLPIIVLIVVISSPLEPNVFPVYASVLGVLFLLVLPIWPLSYIYALHKHGPGDVEFRANRLLGAYGFFSAYITLFAATNILVYSYFGGEQLRHAIASMVLSLIFVVVFGPARSWFQGTVDRLIYGIKYEPETMVSMLAARIPSASNQDVLRQVIKQEILPTMLIRQSALYLMSGDTFEVLYQDSGETPTEDHLPELGAFLDNAEELVNLDRQPGAPFGWVRLVVPLASQDHRVGAWMFGIRDPDDFYPRSDIELLSNLGNQISPVIENMRLFEMSQLEIKENRRLQAQLVQSQKMEAIGRLSAGVAHDFNNLLSVILGYSSLLIAKYGDDPALKKILNDIRDAGNRAAALTKQLLAFSRQQVMEARVMDLNDVVIDVEKMLRRLTGEDVEVETYLSDDLPSVKVDPGQMGQVIMNLAVNARDAMPEGGRLTIATAALHLERPLDDLQQGEVPAGKYVRMTVRDSGTGVDPDLLPRIFEPYFTTKELGKGTGLGLSMVYGIINQSRGFIRVESSVGEGTVFLIYLPVANDSGSIPHLVAALKPSATFGDETILLVEDEDSVRMVACEILEAKGYQVIQACDGEEALEYFENYLGRIDLLLTDVIMPRMKGTELASRLNLLSPETRIMYMSGYNEESILGKRLGEEGTVLIQKPFSPQGLAQKVREVLDA